jgi:hypothetical protein
MADPFEISIRRFAEQGMSRQAAHRFQSLADIPVRDFEAALRGPE